MCLILFGLLYIGNLIRSRRNRIRIVHLLVEQVQTVLSDQKERSLREPSVVPYISVNHLRDSLILNFRRSTKQKIWEHVRKLIRMNSCIKESIQIVGGEEHRVWEWNAPPILSPIKDKKHVSFTYGPSGTHLMKSDRGDPMRVAFTKPQGPLYPSISSPSTIRT
jgi:hypothetical protein